jgi:hypothetical protein
VSLKERLPHNKLAIAILFAAQFRPLDGVHQEYDQFGNRTGHAIREWERDGMIVETLQERRVDVSSAI